MRHTGREHRSFSPSPSIQGAVRRIAAETKSLAEVAHELGLGESLLRRWKQALADEGEQASPGKGNTPVLVEELRRLRAENQRLRMECEISRK
jgi:transposase-like protein